MKKIIFILSMIAIGASALVIDGGAIVLQDATEAQIESNQGVVDTDFRLIAITDAPGQLAVYDPSTTNWYSVGSSKLGEFDIKIIAVSNDVVNGAALLSAISDAAAMTLHNDLVLPCILLTKGHYNVGATQIVIPSKMQIIGEGDTILNGSVHSQASFPHSVGLPTVYVYGTADPFLTLNGAASASLMEGLRIGGVVDKPGANGLWRRCFFEDKVWTEEVASESFVGFENCSFYGAVASVGSDSIQGGTFVDCNFGIGATNSFNGATIKELQLTHCFVDDATGWGTGTAFSAPEVFNAFGCHFKGMDAGFGSGYTMGNAYGIYRACLGVATNQVGDGNSIILGCTDASGSVIPNQ